MAFFSPKEHFKSSWTQSLFRESRYVKRTGNTPFGEVKKEEVKKENASTTPRETTPLLERKSAEAPLSPFDKITNDLFSKFQQACLQGDFAQNEADEKGQYDTELLDGCTELSRFLEKLDEIKKSLQTARQQRKTPNQWFQDNEELIKDFVSNLNVLYTKRNTPAVVKTFVCQIADAFGSFLAAAGLTTAVLKLAGMGVLAGPIGLFLGACIVPLAIERYKHFYSEEAQLRAAMKETLTAPDPGTSLKSNSSL